MHNQVECNGQPNRPVLRPTRSWGLRITIVGILVFLGALGMLLYPPGTHADPEPVQYVNPFIGTVAAPRNTPLGGGFDSGNVFPGAVFPHGMVQWSPDTTTAPGGYRYNQSTIHGFSLTHFSGRGCSAYQDFPFQPFTGPLQTGPFSFADYAATFSHQQEAAEPGYYRVRLPVQNIQVELTATLRTGFGRFTYPATSNAAMLINAGGSANGNTSTGTGIQIIGNNEITGEASSGHFCGGGKNVYTVYFAAQFDQPFVSLGTWQGKALQPGSRQSSGSRSGAYVTFDTTRNRVVQVKVGLSFVSVNNALLNLEQENPGWNFPSVRTQAWNAWNEKLSQIQVQGGSDEEKQVFYTALYHTLIHPNVFSDVNGEYIGFDGKVHQALGYTQYENFPGWDMYRSLIALRALLEPRVVGDMLQSLVEDAQQGGGGLPRWEVANDNSGGMVGDSIDVVIATSYALGVRNFDTQGALRAMEQGASVEGTRSGRALTREGMAEYLSKGYVSTTTSGSASITLEYAIDDFAIAQFAGALGYPKTEARYLKRAQNWQKLFDPQVGYIVPRNPDGSFLSNFSPTSTKGFVEGDSAQYTWMVPQDFPGLFARMGGNAQAVARLDQHFQKLNDGSSSPYAFMGNEPEFGSPWAYDFAGRPDRTEDVVRRIELQLFDTTPGGLPGNDDGGAMSSWYIFAAIGLYPSIPGVGGFALGSPLFSSVQLYLGNGSRLTITGQGAADNSPYVQSLSLNNQPWSNPWLPYSKIQDGGTLAFVLGSRANTGWSTTIQMSK
jgi:predicted alpha-1,2-mannosidase